MLSNHCLYCDSALVIMGAILKPSVIVRILAYLGVPTRVPPSTLSPHLDLLQSA